MKFATSNPMRAVLVCALLASGCSSTPVTAPVTLIELDKEWASTYASKLEADRASPAANGNGASPFDSKLADLSVRAEKQGDALLATDPATAAGFYRIAATSAWKSGAVREAQVLPIRDKGVRACEALPNRDASQPRDCALIRIAPLLATLDVKTREVQALRDAGETIPADKLHATQIVTSDVAALIKEVLNMRATVTSLPESFDDYLKLSLNREFCMLQGLTGRFAASAPTEAQKARVIEAVRGAQTSLRNAAISTTCN
jgi:hypothetical protein